MQITALSNEEILSSLTALVAQGNRISSDIITYLAEVEERRIHLELACPSMFEFCQRKLGFSEGETFLRLAAARLVRRFPAVLEAIASGRVHVSNVVLLRDHFSEGNVEELLAQVTGRSKREAEQLVARLAPKPDVLSSIRKLPETAAPKHQGPIATPSPMSACSTETAGRANR
jgi:hypothetical protein